MRSLAGWLGERGIEPIFVKGNHDPPMRPPLPFSFDVGGWRVLHGDRPLPASPFELVEWREATVHPDCHVALGKRLYSVPWQLVGRKVLIRSTRTSVVVYDNDEPVATHPRHP